MYSYDICEFILKSKDISFSSREIFNNFFVCILNKGTPIGATLVDYELLFP